MGVSGAQLSCSTLPVWQIRSQAGWLDDHRLLIQADSASRHAVWLVYNTSTHSVARSGFPSESDITVDASGKWAAIAIRADGGDQLMVSPSDRFDLARRVISDATTSIVPAFASRQLPSMYLDSIAIVSPAAPIAPDVPHRLMAFGWSRSRLPMTVSATQWRSLTKEIATIDSSGTFIARKPGRAVIEVSAGGWRTAQDTLRVEVVPVTVVLDEQWGTGAFDRWRVFGIPEPVVVVDNGGRAFFNRGDGIYFSGAYLRRAIDSRNGLAIDIEVSSPITQPQWQVLIAGFQEFSREEGLVSWDHRTGYIQHYLADKNPGCWFSYPAGEGEDAVTRNTWYRGLVAASGEPGSRINTGTWYTVRLQVFPDGRCGLAINGKALEIRPGPGKAARLHAIIQGSSEKLASSSAEQSFDREFLSTLTGACFASTHISGNAPSSRRLRTDIDDLAPPPVCAIFDVTLTQDSRQCG